MVERAEDKGLIHCRPTPQIMNEMLMNDVCNMPYFRGLLGGVLGSDTVGGVVSGGVRSYLIYYAA